MRNTSIYAYAQRNFYWGGGHLTDLRTFEMFANVKGREVLLYFVCYGIIFVEIYFIPKED